MTLNRFDKILFINLKHRTDKKLHILKQLSKLDVKKSKIIKIAGTYVPFNGHLGCVLSHIDALNYAIENKLNNVLILEDDCFFSEDKEFVNFSIEYFFKIVNSWDVFLFGGHFLDIEKSKYPYINKINKSYRSHAYAVNNSYFQTLKDHFEKTALNLENIFYHFHATAYALDRTWNELQKKDIWLAMNLIIAGQIEGYSDIGLEKKERR